MAHRNEKLEQTDSGEDSSRQKVITCCDWNHAIIEANLDDCEYVTKFDFVRPNAVEYTIGVFQWSEGELVETWNWVLSLGYFEGKLYVMS